jgi:hypothetical protein
LFRSEYLQTPVEQKSQVIFHDKPLVGIISAEVSLTGSSDYVFRTILHPVNIKRLKNSTIEA